MFGFFITAALVLILSMIIGGVPALLLAVAGLTLGYYGSRKYQRSKVLSFDI